MTKEKFLSCVKKKDNGCWEWQKSTAKGYGRCNESVNGKRVQLAHRYSYILFKGFIPQNKHLDHLCRNHGCVNPDHLEPVTNYENMMRGNASASINAKKTHCIHGHEFTDENTITRMRRGRLTRECRQCGRDRTIRWENKNPNYYHDYYKKKKSAV